MGRAKSSDSKALKAKVVAKNEAASARVDKQPLPAKVKTSLSVTQVERLARLVDIQHIAEHGFSKDVWMSLSFEDKMNLPAYISSKFRQSNGTKVDKMKNNEKKRIVHNQIMKYEKYAKRKFYSVNKKKIKTIQKNDGLTSEKALCFLWDGLDDATKDEWYNNHCAASCLDGGGGDDDSSK